MRTLDFLLPAGAARGFVAATPCRVRRLRGASAVIFRQLVAIAVFLTLSIASAFAQGCSPPAGMSIQQWYSICSPALQQAYAQGMGGQNLPYDRFVQSMYQTYAQPVVSGPMPGGVMCAVGQMQCFNGYLRQCQTMPTGGSWWVTGPQQCR